ncbi:MAG: cytochrome c biogenesis protein CcsA [Planctomycetota bacterium]
MATGEVKAGLVKPTQQRPPVARGNEADPLLAAAHALASLRLTVVLFAAAILLILFGTLAQVHHDIWHVVRQSHFRVWWAWVEWRAIGRLIELVFGGQWQSLGGGFWFPGGIPIGGLMLLNLLAAHTLRFKVTARGGKLLTGLGLLAVGAAATAAVVVTSNQDTIKSELSPQFADLLWNGLKVGAAALAVAAGWWSVRSYGRVRTPEWVLGSTLAIALVAGAGWLIGNGDWRLDEAGLRILWQLVKGTAAAGILLAACVLLFAKRGGMVLLHGGIVLMMVGEAITGFMAEEATMRIDEGQTVNYAYDIREAELAFTDASNPDEVRVTVIPQSLIARAAGGAPIGDAALPFDVRVEEFNIHSRLFNARPKEENPATKGVGLQVIAQPAAPVSGVDNEEVNVASTYVELLSKETGESLGTYLGHNFHDQEQAVDAGEKTYGMELRYKRVYKPYSVKLHDFSFTRYPGTEIAKDFRAEVRLIDPSKSVDRDVAIWMNNPLRYGGDTLYQSRFDQRSEETTYLQVVTNGVWLVPYLSCQIVLVGMLWHFGQSLQTFARRRIEEAARRDKAIAKAKAGPQRVASTADMPWTSPAVLVPTILAIVWGGYLLSKSRPQKVDPGEMQIAEFGALPLAHGGRLKPIDTFARNTLQALNNRQSVKLDEESELAKTLGVERVSATQWMLDVITRREPAGDFPVFQIDNLEVLELLDLERRPGSRRYSYNEVMGVDETGEQTNRDVIGKQLDLVVDIDPDRRTVFQNHVSQLGSKLSIYHRMANAYAPLPITTGQDRLMEQLISSVQQAIVAERVPGPRSVPPGNPGGPWLTMYEGELNELFNRFPDIRQRVTSIFAGAGPMASESLDKLLSRFDAAGKTEGFLPLNDALEAYRTGKTRDFNTKVRKLRRVMAASEEELGAAENAAIAAGLLPVEKLNLGRSRFEAWFNGFSPFFLCMVSYIAAFVLQCVSWVKWPRTLGRAAVAIVSVTFVLHTLALVARVYMSGRAPVTNLASSALFVSWGVVLIGIATEAIYRMGLGSVVATAFAAITLKIAELLGLDGDTMAVMQAVLDTNFWLWTHVLCISAGYVATFFAGGVGMYYLVRCHMLGQGDAQEHRRVEGIIYGVTCFAIFFSFVGTVLGGLWGDNSWGRFWGWDPKENGALIIVLWNALILHARWGKMTSRAGIAALAVAGNMFTTWSWFGTNELGVGLHAYGGLSDEVSLELGIVRGVFYSHPWLILLAAAPADAWRGFWGKTDPAAEPTA